MNSARKSLVSERSLKMKKPKYMQEMLKIIFLWLGIMFIGMSSLSALGVLKPKDSSAIQDPFLLGIVFFVIGIGFILMSIVLGIITFKMNRLQAELIANGTRISGKVEKVYLQSSTQYGKQSPYRVLYEYTYQGKKYHQKSSFIWKKPDLEAGDSVVVYVNDTGKSTILLN